MKEEQVSFTSISIKDPDKSWKTEPNQLPIYATSSFKFQSVDEGINIFSGKKDGHVYARFGNPTVEAVAQKIADLEGYGLDMKLYGLFTSSGMSAISTLLMSLIRKGESILTQEDLYGGTTELLSNQLGKFGISTVQMDLRDLERVKRKLAEDKSIRIIFFETPANPTLNCIDIEKIVELGRETGKMVIADNTFSTPFLQQPFKYGVDFVIHSTTKYLNGHGNSVAGVIIGKNPELRHKIWESMKLFGTNSNPWDAWLVNIGLKTLTLRMDKHCGNAEKLANFLYHHPKVEKVNYCGLPSHPDHEVAKKQMRKFGGMLSFSTKGELPDAIRFMNHIKFCTLAPTLGDVDTLILHPASMSHLNVDKEIRIRTGITDTLIRISVGIEEFEDILRDIEQALEMV